MRIVAISCMFLVGCAAQGELAFTTDLVDFGAVLPGVERTEQVELINRSDTTLMLTSASSSSPSFSLSFPERLTIAPGATVALTLHHVPTMDVEEATLDVKTQQGLTASLRATSFPTTPDCTLPAQLDFGAVARGDSLNLDVALQNSTARDSTVFVGGVESAQGLADFRTMSGTFPVGAGEELQQTFSFFPLETREYAASVRLQRHPLCAEQPMRLIGTGVASVLTWTPPTSSSSARVGESDSQLITLTNLRFTAVPLLNMMVREGSSPSSAFQIVRQPLSVPAAQRAGDGTIIAGEATIEVSFTPNAIGPHAAQLSANTDLSSQPTISVNLRGDGQP